MNDLLTAAKYALIPVAAIVAGTIAAAFRPPGPYWRSATQHSWLVPELTRAN